ncbi:hypothetical protein ACHQM5_023478 [Ranunculus cassubicifolius]
MSRVHDLEQATVESAKKRDQAWQLELDTVQKNHASDVEALSQQFQLVQKQLVSALKDKDEAIRMVETLEKAKSREREVPNNIELEEVKVEIISLKEKIGILEESVAVKNKDLEVSHQCLEKAKLDTHAIKEAFETLKSDFQVAKDVQADAQEREGIAMSKVRSLTEEMNALKNEVKLATSAEENSRKAMDEMALVMIEVSNENKELKESLRLKKSELDRVNQEAEILKQGVRPTEEKYLSLLMDTRKELDQEKSVSGRLKMEAEDSILAWNQKELEFINCIRNSDEESNGLKQENSKLKVSLKKAEDMAKVAREENTKLRDILKQALNETTAAKEAAEIAREENSELKDNLLDKEDVLQELARENERLRIKETAGHETIKELKKLLSSSSARELNPDNMIPGILSKEGSLMNEHEDSRKIKEILNIKFEEPQISNGHKTDDEDPEMAEMLKGSIFDVADSPVAPKPVSHHRKMSSSVFSDNGESLYSEDIDHLDGSQLDDTEDKNSQRKRKALLRRFGDLLRRTSFHRTSVG